MRKQDMLEIIASKILLVEGQDEINLFTELLSDLELEHTIQVIQVGGKDKFPGSLKTLRILPDFHIVKSIGLVRDADNDPVGAFQSVCNCLRNVELPVPTAPLKPKTGPPQITIMIVPDIDTKGMIENVCLNSVSNDSAMPCIDQYFQCLQSYGRELAENNVPKARVRAFLASREWLEIAHFEYLQKCMESYLAASPQSPAVSAAKVHVFLASRYTPDLNLGTAAQKSDSEDSYWQFNHPAFDKIKNFLRML